MDLKRHVSWMQGHGPLRSSASFHFAKAGLFQIVVFRVFTPRSILDF